MGGIKVSVKTKAKETLNKVYCYDEGAIPSIVVTFNKIEDAQAVINNPNFRETLDTIYKN